VAITGWHVPSNAEWDTLQNFLISNGYNWDKSTIGNKIAKSLAAQTNWFLETAQGSIGNDLAGNNSSGFSALPGGYRGAPDEATAQFRLINTSGYWWSATQNQANDAFARGLNYQPMFPMGVLAGKMYGYSVRLIKN
jgi:uncharacterized protein (TIGR02145 family)